MTHGPFCYFSDLATRLLKTWVEHYLMGVLPLPVIGLLSISVVLRTQPRLLCGLPRDTKLFKWAAPSQVSQVLGESCISYF